QLPHNLTVPFARFIARNKQKEFKRFCFGHVYRKNLVGGQPRQLMEADFDIVHPKKSLILHSVLKKCMIDDSRIMSFLSQLSFNSWDKLKRNIVLNLNIPSKSLEMLESALNLKSCPTKISERLTAFGIIEKDVFADLEELVSYVQSMGLVDNIVFDPFLVLSNSYYHDFYFHFIVNNKKKDLLALGGRYDDLVKSFCHPTEINKQPKAIGVVFSIPKIVNYLGAGNERLPLPFDVLVHPLGRCSLNERLVVTTELWKAGIRTEFTQEQSLNVDLEEFYNQCKAHGIKFVVLVKEKAFKTQQSVIKIRNVEKKSEMEINREELVDTLKSLLQGKEIGARKIINNSAVEPTLEARNINVHIVNTQQKMKFHKKNFIIEKANQKLTSLISSVADASVVTEVVAVDLSRFVISNLINHEFKEEEVKKSMGFMYCLCSY
ncbi:hypothetical protein ROZALSC1DRAFT_31680, partial [Rozella allomycis CSF55]